MDTVSVKIAFCDQVRRLSLPSPPQYGALDEAVANCFPEAGSQQFLYTYLDSDADKVRIASQQDLDMAVIDSTPLKIYVSCLDGAGVIPADVSANSSMSVPAAVPESVSSSRPQQEENKDEPELVGLFREVFPWRAQKVLAKWGGDVQAVAEHLSRRWSNLIAQSNGDLTQVKTALLQRKEQRRGRREHKSPMWNPPMWNLSEEMKASLNQLQDMGFTNRKKNVRMLRKHNQDVNAVVAKLTKKQAKYDAKIQKRLRKSEKKSAKKSAKEAKKSGKKAKKLEKRLRKQMEDWTVSSSSDTSDSSDSSSSSSSSSSSESECSSSKKKRKLSFKLFKGKKPQKKMFKAMRRMEENINFATSQLVQTNAQLTSLLSAIEAGKVTHNSEDA
jgi:hypothetical protein